MRGREHGERKDHGEQVKRRDERGMNEGGREEGEAETGFPREQGARGKQVRTALSDESASRAVCKVGSGQSVDRRVLTRRQCPRLKRPLEPIPCPQ